VDRRATSRMVSSAFPTWFKVAQGYGSTQQPRSDTATQTISLVAGQKYRFVIEYLNTSATATLEFSMDASGHGWRGRAGDRNHPAALDTRARRRRCASRAGHVTASRHQKVQFSCNGLMSPARAGITSNVARMERVVGTLMGTTAPDETSWSDENLTQRTQYFYVYGHIPPRTEAFLRSLMQRL